MRRFLLILLLVLPAARPAFADRLTRYYDYFNTEAFWDRLILDKTGPAPAPRSSDTCMLIASNRAPGADSLRFMSEDRGDGSLRYFMMLCRAGKWRLYPCAGLREGLQWLAKRDLRPLVVYTEGMGKIFTSDLDRGARMAGQYGVNVLLLDYPSIHSNYGAYKNYRFAWISSTKIYDDFLPVFDSLKAIRPATKTSLFFHSMDNNLLRKLIQKNLLRSGEREPKWVDNIILNAPCVPRHRSRRWIDSLRFSERVYVNYNPEDRVLKLASIAGFRGILGLGPKRQISRNADYINFNGVSGYGHSNFMGLYGRPFPSGAAMTHYDRILKGEPAPLKDADRYTPAPKRARIYMLR